MLNPARYPTDNSNNGTGVIEIINPFLFDLRAILQDETHSRQLL